jgi:hypothetical protein
VTEIIAMRSAEPVIFGVVKIVLKDEFAGAADLRPITCKRRILNFLRLNPARFDDLKLEGYGQNIFWLNDDGDEIEFGSDTLRKRVERQAGLLHLAG